MRTKTMKIVVCKIMLIIGLSCTNFVNGQLAATGNDLGLYYINVQPVQEQIIQNMAGYYISTTDRPADWLLDGLILYSIDLYHYWDPNQNTCTAYINDLFDNGHQIATLNSIIGNLKTQLGAPAGYKWNVVLTIPVNKTTLGSGGNAVNNCTTLWNEWQAINPSNLELVGFYWGYTESMAYDSTEANVCRAAANYIHNTLNKKVFWIPYLGATGVANWASDNIDYVTQQPNYAFTNPPLDPSRFGSVNTNITNWGLHGAELEIDNASNGLSVIHNAADYLYYAESYKWNDRFLATYYNEAGFERLGRNVTPFARGVYEQLYRYISPNLKGQWRFSETSGTSVYDGSSYTNNAVLYSGAARTTEGIYPGGCNFDGVDDYAECPDNASLDITTNLTLEAWVKPEAMPAQYAQIIGRSEGGKRMLLKSDGSLLVQMGTNHATAASLIATNKWYHIVYTSDGTVSTIYVNGSAVSTGSGGANFSSANAGRIGKSYSTNYPFQGKIDEARIYSRKLSNAEVMLNYLEGLDRLNLRGGWPLDEANGSITNDCSVASPVNSNIYGAIWTCEAISGAALRFDGVDDYVECPDNNPLDITGAITLEAWINPESVPSGYAQIVGRADSGLRMLLKNDGSILVQMGNNHTTAASAVKFNEWNHVVYTSNGTTSYVYVNGVQIGSAGNGGANFTSGYPVRIGKSYSTFYPFKGMIDEVRIYARTLTGAEVLAKFAPYQQAFWRFENNTQDNSGHGNNATNYGASYFNPGANSDYALYFEGNVDADDDYVECPDSAGLDITDAITLEAWINPEVMPSDYAQIVGRSENGKRMLLKNDGSLLVQMGTNHSTAASIITTNKWYHVIYVSNGTTSKIYINGENVSTGSSGANFSSTNPVRIGKSYSDYYPFQGFIDEVSIHSGVLLPEEISLRYNRTLRGLWKFNEGTGTDAKDSSGHNNKGNVNGSTWWTGDVVASGKALYFDASGDYVEIPVCTNLGIVGGLTLEAWIKPELGALWTQIIGRADYDQRMLVSRDGQIQVSMGNVHNTNTGVVAYNKLNYIVYTSDGLTSRIYVNGLQVGSTGNGGSNFSSNYALRIGKSVGEEYPFKGVIDEVAVHAHVMTSDEIMQKYSEFTWRGGWRLNGDFADSSMHQNDAANYGASWVENNTALYFEGSVDANDDFVDCGTDPSLGINGALTIEAWIRPEAFSTYGQIVGRSETGRRVLLKDDGKIVVQMGTNHETANPAVTIDGSTWYHIAYTSNGTTSTIYVNGSAVSTGNGGANFSSVNPVRIGKSSGDYYPFKGSIDEVNIYARVLTSSEVAARWQAGRN